jgi:two-component system NarL family sensor kinase
MISDERHNREVAEHLHDGPLQTLLAARLELDEVRERHPDPARELLTNIGKHAAATTARISLSRRGDRVVLTIADDGTGFDPEIVGHATARG